MSAEYSLDMVCRFVLCNTESMTATRQEMTCTFKDIREYNHKLSESGSHLRWLPEAAVPLWSTK